MKQTGITALNVELSKVFFQMQWTPLGKILFFRETKTNK